MAFASDLTKTALEMFLALFFLYQTFTLLHKLGEIWEH